LKDPLCQPLPRWLWFLRQTLQRCECTRWWLENGLDLVQLMRYYLEGVERIYIFGEPFENGLGIHNVHMTQGDPIGSPFAVENGIWQDGGILLEYGAPQPHVAALLTKFETQSLNTDDMGRPT
ncbi:MAG TPA: DUF2278 family protein, partial [Ardenticatenaceae bacterium]|nr:DUF2278 family protein [Ardenticatenaceae bacterium]